MNSIVFAANRRRVPEAQKPAVGSIHAYLPLAGARASDLARPARRACPQTPVSGIPKSRSRRRRKRVMRLRQSRLRRRQEYEKYYNRIRYGHKANRAGMRIPRSVILQERQWRRGVKVQLWRANLQLRGGREKLRQERDEARREERIRLALNPVFSTRLGIQKEAFIN